MPHGVHKTAQTAFRLPEGLLAWLREQAEREERPMTEIVLRALEKERDRCADTKSNTATGLDHRVPS